MRQKDITATEQAVPAINMVTSKDSRGNHQGTMARIAPTVATTAHWERALRSISSNGESGDDKRELPIFGRFAPEDVVENVRIRHI